MAPSHGPVGDFPLKDKIVVITGGGSGIGLALSQQCHAKGAKVLIGDLTLRPEAQKFVDEAGDKVVFTKCDVTQWKDLKNLVDVSLEKFGEVPDVYCPVAGIFEPKWSNLWDDNEDDKGYYATMRINAEHPIKLTRIAMRALLGANKKGVVALVSSGAGLGGIYLSALYCASKHAVVGLCKSMGLADPQEGIKVVCMCPGLVVTPLLTARDDGKESMIGYKGEGSSENAPALGPDDIAECMVRMIEEGRYSGGTIVSKRPSNAPGVMEGGSGESVVFEGGNFYETDGTFVQDLLAKERGVPWVKSS
jgi:NAD(P)-dependent dehydrogenase (short-subunit alcohol dehydrogenase family)